MPRRNQHTGNQDRKLPAGPADLNAANREADVIRLRMAGLEWDAIAARVGYSNGSGAYKAYHRAIARIPAAVADEERGDQLRRINAAVHAIWKEVESGDHWAIDRLVALEERRAKLLGLDAKGDTAMPVVVVREVPREVIDAI